MIFSKVAERSETHNFRLVLFLSLCMKFSQNATDKSKIATGGRELTKDGGMCRRARCTWHVVAYLKRRSRPTLF